MSDNALDAIVAVGFFALMGAILAVFTWHIEKTERATVEHGCATPAPESDR
jgi:hypothetical protein